MENKNPHLTECHMVNPTLAVNDILSTVEFYTTKLGFTMGFLWGNPVEFAGVNLDRVSIHLYKGVPDPKSCSVTFGVDDADALHAFHVKNGVEVVEPLADRPYGMRDYSVRDLNGYYLGFGHPLFNMGPPIRIERVDVPLRLEKRMAAVLQDLAERKHMSLSRCLEETLCHTFEILGEDGVPSPHTRGQLLYIQELKKKHGIDYDSHGCYRFVE